MFNNPLSYTDPSGYQACSGYNTSQCPEETTTTCDADCMERLKNRENAITQWNYESWNNWASRQNMAADVQVGMLVSQAMLNGGSTVWNGVQISVQGYKATGGMVVTGGGTTVVGEGVLGNLLKGVRLGNPLAVLALALSPTKIGGGAIREEPALYRGRIQAQGGGLEKSVSWAQKTPPTVAQGLGMLKELKLQLSNKELAGRANAFSQAERFILNAAPYGVTPTKKSFYEVRGYDIRVDIEVQSGLAFVAE